MKIDVGINNLAGGAVNGDLVKRAVAGVIKGEAAGLYGERKVEVSLVFVGKEDIRRINKKYRKKNAATDVLSFAEGDCGLHMAAAQPVFLGELAICLEIIAEDARESGISCDKELAWAIVHGMLHLFGYDHQKGGKEAAAMHLKEEEYLSKIKLKSVKLKAQGMK